MRATQMTFNDIVDLHKVIQDDEWPFRYDLAGNEPRVILITDLVGSRRAVPRLSYVVIPQRRA